MSILWHCQPNPTQRNEREREKKINKEVRKTRKKNMYDPDENIKVGWDDIAPKGEASSVSRARFF
jgi:hypothetical protein